MTVQPEGTPLTRREIRERERREASATGQTTSRRAATASVTAAGEMPVLTATQAIRITAVGQAPATEPASHTSSLDIVGTDETTGRPLTRRQLRARVAEQATGEASTAPAPAERTLPQAGSTETVSSEHRQDEPKLNTALFSAVGGSLDLPDEKATEITGSFQPPIEHLAITDELDSKSKEEVDASFDSLISNGVAATGAVTTTNALILPTTGAVPSTSTETGEILVTGSFDLPRSLGSTGQHPNLYDSPDVDRYVDRIDREQPDADSEPVRASSAVSTHDAAAGAAVVAPQKRQVVSVPVVLAITAAVLLVGAITLFIGGFVLNIF
ncbi:hypothetical protein [Rathayibacter toxicus]|uniref:Uncharacterized protein n=1 Tax=Rathayibacter toxicus TaxID=145458 RepID=A0A0C5BHC9_9MICO|nr:hypothetical protein [Rathayibacter toxicus]AJM77630.1 hypothetical protein TI83_06140 [Rathayibacter toxicus]ALS56434.1 hypothetical protein APU90_00340 [Rathayibacter toxicus]KKM44542.1 hypothetical protein VT73_08300 [Rathayibacter toxicus]PPG21748.1 hypothetical protein C5D15_05945 [Rathayibacter toxicus]PPG46710.1 hypothetical protein C5D16_05920 [Rathayibacter toxicus]